MRTAEYERLVAKIAASIYSNVEGVVPNQVAYGLSNKWKGQSGYSHQIDVSVRGSADVILIECKQWAKKISAEAVLAFIARVHDIRPICAEAVHPIMASLLGFQRGAKTLAEYYDIDLRRVKSADSFAIGYKKLQVVGVGPARVAC